MGEEGPERCWARQKQGIPAGGEGREVEAKPGSGEPRCRASKDATGREQRESRMISGRPWPRSRCTARILMPSSIPPPKGFASPFLVQGTPSSHARHQPAALHAASTAAEATLQAEGWPREGRTEPGAPGGKMRDTLKPLSGQEGRPDTTEMATRGKQTHHRPGTGGRESIHRAQDLHRGLRAGCVHSRLTPGCTTPGAPWHCEHIPRAPCRAESATSAPGQGREGQQRARTATPRSPPCVPAPGQPSWEPGRSCSIPAARSCCQQL